MSSLGVGVILYPFDPPLYAAKTDVGLKRTDQHQMLPLA
jgi:hypothetical protein